MCIRPALGTLASLCLVAAAAAQTPRFVSIGLGGAGANGPSTGALVSEDGRYVAFTSLANDLALGDGNGNADVYLRDMLTGQTELVSKSSAGVASNAACTLNALTPDGRFVVFATDATNLVPSGKAGVYVRDRQTGQTTQETLTLSGVGAGGAHGQISDDGRYVAFDSPNADIAANEGNVALDVFRRDRQTGITEAVSIAWPAGAPANGDCFLAGSHAMSADGRWVVFASNASNLDPDHPLPQPWTHVFAHDRQTGVTLLLDVTPAGVVANSSATVPCLSADGHFAAFVSPATNLLADANGSVDDLYIRDMQTGALERANVSSVGLQGNSVTFGGTLSADGRLVAFDTWSTNLIGTDPLGSPDRDIYLRDRLTGLTRLVSVDGNGISPAVACVGTDVSRDGTHIGFETLASLAHVDDNGSVSDIYLAEPAAAPSPWTDLGAGLAGQTGVPLLAAEGALTPGSLAYVALANELPGAFALLVVGFTAVNVPLKGGVLVPAPTFLVSIPATPPGHLTLSAHIPPSVPAGTQFFLQYWIKDAAGPVGFAASNALRGITP